jgi:hypothetical protein
MHGTLYHTYFLDNWFNDALEFEEMLDNIEARELSGDDRMPTTRGVKDLHGLQLQVQGLSRLTLPRRLILQVDGRFREHWDVALPHQTFERTGLWKETASTLELIYDEDRLEPRTSLLRIGGRYLYHHSGKRLVGLGTRQP